MTDHKVVSRAEWQAARYELPHLHARDVTLLLVSRARLAKLQAYRERMGWRIPWVSAANTDINGYLSGAPAVSVFTRQDGTVYQTYAAQARGWSSS